MRVHPSIIAPRAAKWQYVAVGLVVFLIMLAGIFRAPKEIPVAAPPQAIEKKIDVIVAREAIQPGQPLGDAKLALEQRPVSTLPKDVITSFEVIKNKIAAGPIPAGYPLAITLLADPVVVLPPEKSTEANADPFDTMLKQMEGDTVAVPVNFSTSPPPKGTRIALTFARLKGDTIIVIDDCWVASSDGREAVLRLDASKALMIQSARSLGNFGFLTLPPDGPSPYAGKGVSSFEELKAELDPKAVAKVEKRNGHMKGYAWVTGEGIRYGIDEQGSIKVVDGQNQ